MEIGLDGFMELQSIIGKRENQLNIQTHNGIHIAFTININKCNSNLSKYDINNYQREKV